MSGAPRVAVACQGGGSHAAFAAGVLEGLLSPGLRGRFELVGLSGTSGGAVCAALAWSGLLAGGPDEAVRRLRGFWDEVAAADPWDAALNAWSVAAARLPVSGEISPYAYQPVAEPALRRLLRRYVDLDALPVGGRCVPGLVVGATEVMSGERAVFRGEDISLDALVASAAIPPLYRAVPIGGRLYWDGLFSTNPPVRDLLDLVRPPDAIWVVQINPQRRAGEPRTVREIEDRRNELAGNLSLGQELYFINKVNALLAAYPVMADRYRPVDIRVVELDLPGLDVASKLDRSPALLAALRARGVARAGDFLDERSRWPRVGTAPAGTVPRVG